MSLLWTGWWLCSELAANFFLKLKQVLKLFGLNKDFRSKLKKKKKYYLSNYIHYFKYLFHYWWHNYFIKCQWKWSRSTPWTVAHQAPPSMGFSRQEYWSGVPFPSPGDLPDPGIKPGSPAFQADALTSEPPGI